MFAEPAAGRHIVERWLLVEQEGQLGPVDLGLGRGVLADEALARGERLIREGWLVGRCGARHAAPPFTVPRPLRVPVSLLYHHPTIPTIVCEMDH